MNDTQRARAAYEAIIAAMDEFEFKYNAHPDKNAVSITITGDDFPVDLIFSVSEESQRLEVYSRLPFGIKPEKAIDIAMALSAINCKITYGKFCLYFDDMRCTFEDSEFITGLEGFSAEYGKDLVVQCFRIVEQYNDKLFAINKGLLSLKDFVESLNK